ncbi:MAG: phospho-sugar mutase [Actinomycetales bacterium]
MADRDLTELIERAQAWAAEDPDEQTRQELLATIELVNLGHDTALKLLASQFAGGLTFGTAGLRAQLGPGPARMNRVVVMQAAAGLATYLRVQHPASCAVVIGFDARHKSDEFARATAQVLAGYGIDAMLLPRPLPTPVLAFAVRHLGCAAGVMVTASHNPACDNGYKVYLGDGCQIIPPVDLEIASGMQAASRLPVSSIPSGTDWVILPDEIEQAYLDAVVAHLVRTSPTGVRCVYTPLHGVGGSVFQKAVAQLGWPAPERVATQFEPDPNFPTVAFPNPEEPGALDLAIAQACATHPDLVIAHDPDADRCAVAVHSAEIDEWRMLTGDELGTILAWWSVQHTMEPGSVLAQSLVSCTLLQSIAETAGLGYQRTLTGFKWIARVPQLRFGYEEALGYCTQPSVVADKDGISAALTVLACAAALRDEGRTLLDVLDEVAEQHGVYQTAQVSVRVRQIEQIPQIMHAWRTTPPEQLGRFPVVVVIDLAQGWDALPPTDGLLLDLGSGNRVIIRPSGTEPKVKCYLQVVEPLTGGLQQARHRADRGLSDLQSAMCARLETW